MTNRGVTLTCVSCGKTVDVEDLTANVLNQACSCGGLSYLDAFARFGLRKRNCPKVLSFSFPEGRMSRASIDERVRDMCDQLTSLASPSSTQQLSLCENADAPVTRPCNVLLVEPAMGPRSDRERLLCAANYSVSIAGDVRDMFVLHLKRPVLFALLHDSLGPFGLRAAAESARRQWPHAKIVILGCAVPALEDHLYDEVCSHRENASSLIELLELMAKRPAGQTDVRAYASYRRDVAALRESVP